MLLRPRQHPASTGRCGCRAEHAAEMPLHPQGVHAATPSHGIHSAQDRGRHVHSGGLQGVDVSLALPVAYSSLCSYMHPLTTVCAWSPFYEDSLEILACCECHPGSLCRTAFALASACQLSGDQALHDKYLQLGMSTRSRIEDPDAQDLGTMPEDYERFVQVDVR